jgi:charged multivesicular body protein 6
MHGLKQGNEVLKEIHKEMNIERVEQLLEETREAQEYQREIDTILANNLSLDDEEAVQTELHELETEAELGRQPIELPSAPDTVPTSRERVEERTTVKDTGSGDRVPMLA